MRKSKIRQVLLFTLLLCAQIAFSQSKGIHFDLSSGLSIPKGLIAGDTALVNKGLQFSTGLNYLGKKFGLEIQSGYFKNPLSPQFLQTFQALPAAADLRFTKDVWQSFYGALGPVLRWGGNTLDWQISPKMGWANVQSPVLGSRSKGIAQGLPLVLQPEDQNTWQLFWAFSTKLQLQLSRRLGLHLRADYIAQARTRETSLEQITGQLRELTGQKGSRQVQDLVLQIARQKSNVLNLGAGITYRFGHTTGSQEKSQSTCETSQLISPGNGAIFLIEGALRPAFHWQNPSEPGVKNYLFRLYNGGKMVLAIETSKNSLDHNNQLEAIYQDGAGEEQSYRWEVVTYFNNCEPLTSDQYFFRMSNRSGVFHDIFELECDEPAYTATGDSRLTGKISFFNNISSSDPLVINNFNDVIIQDASGNPLPGVSLTNLTDCVSSSPVPTPIIIPPGGTQTYCFTLEVPAGNAAIRSEAHGTINGLPQLSTDQDDLPVCSCTVCESWRFSSTLSSLNYVTYGGASFNALVLEQLQIANAAPIREVKAEIVYVQHVANDPQCYTCTKHDNDMGLFSFASMKPKVIITSGNWKNNQEGYKGAGNSLDINNDDFVNQVLWKADDPNVGVDFSSAGHRFSIPINLPKPSSLKCCDHRYEVCIRYTFTDVNCATCDYLACYRMTPKGNGGLGTGGLGTHPGGINPGPKIPMQILKPRSN